jgi:hypothetical protein
MSVSKLDPPHNSHKEDSLDRWQYRLFKVVLFLIAVWAMWKFLNEHVPVEEGIRGFVHQLGY